MAYTQQRPPPPPPPHPGLILRPRIGIEPITNRLNSRVIAYGGPGIGKTTFGCKLPGKVGIFDNENSLAKLQPMLEATGWIKNISSIRGADSWLGMMGALQSDGWEDYRSIVIDTGTRAEDQCVAHVLATVKTEKGLKANSIEDYGYGKGYQHVYDEYLRLIALLDQHYRGGRNVMLIYHDCVTPKPNPAGEDFIHYEMRSQNLASGKSSIRLRLREWADHVIYFAYDVTVNKDGKGIGGGSRTVYCSELPYCMAKSRTLAGSFPLDDDFRLKLFPVN